MSPLALVMWSESGRLGRAIKDPTYFSASYLRKVTRDITKINKSKNI